jgi:hypothetical protein
MASSNGLRHCLDDGFAGGHTRLRWQPEDTAAETGVHTAGKAPHFTALEQYSAREQSFVP